MKTRLTSLLLVVGLLLVCAPLFAHHGSVAYDTTKPVILKDATVTNFAWANPHSFIQFDVKDDKGNVAHWAGECGSPSALSQLGWVRNSVQAGDVITVYIYQSKTGNPVGRLNKIVLASGKELHDSALGKDK
jgi:hypothetical protein